MKKRVLIFLLAGLSTLPLVACTKNEPSTTSEISESTVIEDASVEYTEDEEIEEAEEVVEQERDALPEGQTYGGTLYYSPNGARIPIVTLDDNWIVSDGGALLREYHNKSGTDERVIELDVVGSDNNKFTSDGQIDQWFEDDKHESQLKAADWDGTRHEENVYSTIINTEYGRVAITLCWSVKADAIYTKIVSPLVSEDGEVTVGYMQMAIVDSFGMDADENKQEYHDMVVNMTDDSCIEYLKAYVPALRLGM